MTRLILVRVLLALALTCLTACASDPKDSTEAPIAEQRAAPEPETGLPEAPPLGAPRPKLAPREVLERDEAR